MHEMQTSYIVEFAPNVNIYYGIFYTKCKHLGRKSTNLFLFSKKLICTARVT